MSITPLPTPSLKITQPEARRFMLAHHGLFPPRKLIGKNGILDYIRHVGSIQFDPINIAGRNPDLVLQSRIKNYIPDFLDELLYSDRMLIDGWDKMASIMSISDWPYFAKRRSLMNQPDTDPRRPSQDDLEIILAEVRIRGPVSSLDFPNCKIVDWHWGPTKIARAALESLFSMGKIGVHHRVNNRRSFDLIERLIPLEILEKPNPFSTNEAYQDWHVLRRIGSMGLVSPKSDAWLGILDVKSKERRTILRRLTDGGKLIAIEVDGITKSQFFIRNEDRHILDEISDSNKQDPGAAIIAPLDNLIWNRGLIQQIFDFEYTWEVYKPKKQRKFGYYVLPVILGDQFIARFEPVFDKNDRVLKILNWWWENGITLDTSQEQALIKCLRDFFTYLGAEKIWMDPNIRKSRSLSWMQDIRVV
jgi:uncharacterized protein YcaQ